jgi:hypothetical protein
MQPEIINFDNQLFRSSAIGTIVTKPKGDSPMDKYQKFLVKFNQEKQKLLDKIEAATKKRDAINKETSPKGWEKENSKIDSLNNEFSVKIGALKAHLDELASKKDDVILSKTCISYLIDIYVQVKYGRSKQIKSLAVKKGNIVEDQSIGLLEEVDDEFGYEKNLQRIFDDFIEGECDIEHLKNGVKIIKDVKSSWDANTFQPKTIEKINSDYWWQGQGYLWLYKGEIFELCYCLVNTPDGIIEDRKRAFFIRNRHQQ